MNLKGFIITGAGVVLFIFLLKWATKQWNIPVIGPIVNEI